MSQQTPLFNIHKAQGARFVDFAGWQMPINYGSQIEEHHAVRQHAGMFDVSHMRSIELTGPDSQGFLRYLLANDVAKLTTAGKALYSCMLNPDGGVIDDLIVYYFSDESYRLVVNAATADNDIAWMRTQMAQFGGTPSILPRPELAMIAVQGPEARALVWQARPNWQAASAELKPFFATTLGEVLIARTGYTGEDGFEISLPAVAAQQLWQDLSAIGIRPAGLGARDTLRLEAGMNLYGQDMDEQTSPLDAGLAWTIDVKDSGRDFIGKKALAAQQNKRAFVGLILQDKGVLRQHMKVSCAAGEGETTSGGFSPSMEKSIAFARLPNTVQTGDEVTVDIRGRQLAAHVVKLPFVRNGKVLV